MTDYELNSIQKFGESVHNGKWSNNGLVQLIELAGRFLNIETLPKYAANQKISYNGAKMRYKTKGKTIFGAKFIIDNE